MVLEAAPLALLAALDARLVHDHDVVVVQEVLLHVDPVQAFPGFLGCCSILPVLGLLDLLRAATALMLQAFPEVLEVREVADLKTSHIWETTGARRSLPSPWFEYEPDRPESESRSHQGDEISIEF